MARIKDLDSYEYDTSITVNDYLIGSDYENNGATKNFKVGDLATYISNNFGGGASNILIKEVELGSFYSTPDQDTSIVNKINTLTSFTVLPTELCIFTGEFVESGNPFNTKFVYALQSGEGTYGTGGTQITISDLVLVNPKQPETERNTYIVDSLTRENKIHSGNIVLRQDTLTFDVFNFVFTINGITYLNISPQVITLDDASVTPNEDRIDVFAVDATTGNVVLIKGTPSVTPQEPTIEFGSQIFVTSVYIPSGATTPQVIDGQDFEIDVITNETDAEPNEWNLINTPAFVDVNDTVTTPYKGTKSINVGSLVSGVLTYRKDSLVTYDPNGYLQFGIKLSQPLSEGNYGGSNPDVSIIKITLSNSTDPSQRPSNFFGTVRNGTFGLSPFDNNTTDWQQVNLPMLRFQYLINNTPAQFDTFSITFTRCFQLNIDDVKLQVGVSVPIDEGHITSTKQILNEGADGTSTYVEQDELNTLLSQFTDDIGATDPIVANTYFIDSSTGDNGTGEYENKNKPFTTIDAAITHYKNLVIPQETDITYKPYVIFNILDGSEQVISQSLFRPIVAGSGAELPHCIIQSYGNIVFENNTGTLFCPTTADGVLNSLLFGRLDIETKGNIVFQGTGAIELGSYNTGGSGEGRAILNLKANECLFGLSTHKITGIGEYDGTASISAQGASNIEFNKATIVGGSHFSYISENSSLYIKEIVNDTNSTTPFLNNIKETSFIKFDKITASQPFKIITLLNSESGTIYHGDIEGSYAGAAFEYIQADTITLIYKDYCNITLPVFIDRQFNYVNGGNIKLKGNIVKYDNANMSHLFTDCAYGGIDPSKNVGIEIDIRYLRINGNVIENTRAGQGVRLINCTLDIAGNVTTGFTNAGDVTAYEGISGDAPHILEIIGDCTILTELADTTNIVSNTLQANGVNAKCFIKGQLRLISGLIDETTVDVETPTGTTTNYLLAVGGGGDVTQAGNNVFTGDNVFLGNNSFVSLEVVDGVDDSSIMGNTSELIGRTDATGIARIANSNILVDETTGVVTLPNQTIAETTNPKTPITKEYGDANYLGGASNLNIFIPTLATDFTSPNIANANKIWELRTVIDLGGADVDLSTYNITLKDGGGLITNFNTFNLGDFRTEGNPYATYFDQSFDTEAGTVTGEPTTVYKSVIGQCLDEVVYVNWFSPNKNADLISGATLNGALPDHVAIQNAIAVTPKQNGTIAFPVGAWLLQGDGTNADYTYVGDPYVGAGNVVPDAQDDYLGTHQGFTFEEYDNLTILGNGATILAHPSQTPVVNNRGFYFEECDNLYIENLTYDGNLVQRDPYLVDTNPFNVQHGFHIAGSNNPFLKKIIAKDCVMDGFYFGTTNGVVGYGGTMIECQALYNYRQGMSVVSHSAVKVYSSIFSFTGQRISTTGQADSRFLTTSPSAGVDMEAGGAGTSPSDRGQFDWLYEGCRFESNYGSGLAIHWGSTRCVVRNCVFIDDELFEPQDSVEETTGNNTYEFNSFTNSSVRLEAGGAHFNNNIFFIDDFIKSYGLFSPATTTDVGAEIVILDEDNHYDLGYTRKAIIKNNLIKVEATNSNFPDELDGGWNGVSLGKLTVNVKDVEVTDNTFINCLGIQSGGGDNTVVDIGSAASREARRVENNVWSIDADVLVKYPNNVGRMRFDEFNGSHKDNDIYSGYANLSGFEIFGSYPSVERRGSYSKFQSKVADIDDDEAYEIFVPNDDGDLKITVVGGDDVGDAIAEFWFSTYDTSYRKGGHQKGSTESSWYFSDPATATNPKSGNTGYRIVCKYDQTAANGNYNTQIIAEWYGSNGNIYNEDEFVITKTTSVPAVTFRRVYDGGKTGNTASRPTTGGTGNYTEIRDGSTYYDTDTNTWVFWNGSAWTSY